jgi:hypothetical protein
MNSKAFATMGLKGRLCYLLKDRRGGAEPELVDKAVRVVIGGTVYLVSSFFRKDAKGDAADKVRRLIEREAEQENMTGMPGRSEV